MDVCDIAEGNTEIISKANCYQSHKPTPEGPATGYCWFCGETVSPGRRWCDKACCDDWQLENN